MSLAVEAIYERGVLRLLHTLKLAEGEKVSIIVLEPVAAKLAKMREAMSDPMFLADLQEVAEDFQHVDVEENVQ